MREVKIRMDFAVPPEVREVLAVLAAKYAKSGNLTRWYVYSTEDKIPNGYFPDGCGTDFVTRKRRCVTLVTSVRWTGQACAEEVNVKCRKPTQDELYLAAIEQKPVLFIFETESMTLASHVEAAVFYASRTLWCHLRKTGQIPGRMSEVQANRWALDRLVEYREACSLQKK